MKITDIKTLITFANWRNFIFVKVFTDEGIVGVGEASLEWSELAVAGAIRNLSPLVIGRDPSRIEELWQSMFRDPYWRGGPVITTALSGIEQALWDIAGKRLGVPVYQLLGGKCRDRLRAYANAWYKGAAAPEDFAERAARTVEKGYTALKWDPFGSADLTMDYEARKRAIDIVRAVREAVGEKVDLLVEAHGRLNPATAIEMARQLEEFHPYWYEEPVPPDNLEALSKVAAATSIPIATGERLYTKYGFRELLSSQAADIIQPDLCHAGGILEVKKIAAMAEAWYVPVAPHNPNGPVGTAATVHLGACTPNFLILEYFCEDEEWLSEIVEEPIRLEKGEVIIPERPGLGIELKEAGIAKRPYQPVRLSLFEAGWEGRL
ncbi:MAG: galactonate dehydratase [bacterium]